MNDADMDARLRRMEQTLRGIPSRWAGGADRIVQVQVLETSTGAGVYNKALGYSSLKGAKYTATPVVALATAYDPAAPVTITDDGVAYATAFLPTGTEQVLVTTLTVNGLVSPLTFDLPGGCVFLCYRRVQLPTANPLIPFVSAYQAYWA